MSLQHFIFLKKTFFLLRGFEQYFWTFLLIKTREKYVKYSLNLILGLVCRFLMILHLTIICALSGFQIIAIFDQWWQFRWRISVIWSSVSSCFCVFYNVLEIFVENFILIVSQNNHHVASADCPCVLTVRLSLTNTFVRRLKLV